MRRPAPRGVTLIELAVVVALVALLLLAIIPSASTWIRNIQIRNVATSLQTGLQKARAEAMRRNTNVRFSLVRLSDSAVMDDSCVVDDDGSSWVVSLDDPGGKCGTVVDETTAPRILDKQATGGGGKWVKVQGSDSANQPGQVVVFNGFGRPVDNTGLAQLDIDNDTSGNDFRALRIVVGAGGTIRMCEPSVNASGDPRKC
ncbi:GspH/FimT family pseudopilin [Roseateles puraquae]|uniref:GspH/FimT family pseudopilin n=1 Tax=Roseateles puraquae TaxID=431059 RepID=UPI0031DF061F